MARTRRTLRAVALKLGGPFRYSFGTPSLGASGCCEAAPLGEHSHVEARLQDGVGCDEQSPVPRGRGGSRSKARSVWPTAARVAHCVSKPSWYYEWTMNLLVVLIARSPLGVKLAAIVI